MQRAFTIMGVLATLTMTTVATLADEYRGTAQQQMACTPDVFRFCGSAIPDVDRIVVCLRQNTPQLSSGCRAVFDASDSVPPPAPGAAQVAKPQQNSVQRNRAWNDAWH